MDHALIVLSLVHDKMSDVGVYGMIHCDIIYTLNLCIHASKDRMSTSFLNVSILDSRIILFKYSQVCPK